MGLDLLIRNGTVVDGSGAARYRADVGIKDGRIAEIGRIRSAAERTIDADGLIGAPGFIDGHTHIFAMKDVGWADPTVAQLSAERGAHPVEVMIDLVLENDDQMFVQPLVNEQPDHVLGMLRHPRTLATFSDSGAHVCQEMGSSLQTHMLSYWVRQKLAFTLEEAVRKLTFDNASAWDLNDRGLVRTGYQADIVVFDEARVKPAMPTVETDLPGGARRLVQKADGIAATIVNGQVTLQDGMATGNVPGQLLRGPGARVA